MRTAKFFVLAVLVVVLVATPFALAGAKKGNLHANGGGPGKVPQGFVKLKYDKDGAVHLFEVQIRKVPAEIYDVFVWEGETEPVDLEPIGTIDIAEDQGAGKFKFNARRGKDWPLADLDPAGAHVEVRDSLGVAILEGTVPDPNDKKK
ncbi:MAG: hypothetical protein MUE73_09695 [Planctomycetes bacterium]|jgi:hypothetical protein|nr:hypothetical protein [Planctomycetota bacterium]